MFNKTELTRKLKLYLICGEGETPESLPGKVEAALAGGVTAVQLRVKSWASREIFQSALTLSKIVKRHGAVFIVNDRIDIALACCAGGVHLGQKDIPADVARKIVPPDFIIGCSARTRDQAKTAQELGVDYLGCGSAFETVTKRDAVVIGPQGIKDAIGAVDIPCVAIGGITLKNLHLLADCGCAGISLASAILDSPAPELSARGFIAEIDRVLPR